MRYWRGLTGFVLFLVVALLTAWPTADSLGQTKREVNIGFSGPISGVAAEYGQDCANGVEMAINDINQGGGINVAGEKCLFKLIKLDDRADPTVAVNNARSLNYEYKAPAVFNPVFNTLAAIAKINEDKGNEFLLMAYTSTPKVIEIGNKLLLAIPPPFTVYLKSFAAIAWEKGWRKAAMLITLGAYGDEWRAAFREHWQAKGGQITADKPANYYTETDFSAQLTAALATKPDVLVIGGPSAPTALVIEQARELGYKGGVILIDQAKVDYIENILKGTQLLGGTIGVAAVAQTPLPATPGFDKKYVSAYKRMLTWEAAMCYDAMHALARAMVAAGTVSDPIAIRASFSKAFPLRGNKFPVEYFGVSPGGRMEALGAVQTIDDRGKYSSVRAIAWWLKDEDAFNELKTQAQFTGHVDWVFFKFEKDQ